MAELLTPDSSSASSASGAILDIKRRHPLYEAWSAQVDLLSRSYVGGEEYSADTFLDQYLRETNTQYEERKGRAYYLNFVAAVVDSYVSAIFRRDPVRELPDSFRDFEEDATGEGDSLTDFTREAMTWAIAALRAFVVVDIDEGGVPYAHLVHPANLLDFARDPRTGEYLWALIAEKRVQEADPFSERLEEDQYRLWTPERWMVFDAEGRALEDEANRAAVVPLIEVVPGNMPLPMVDIARINRRIYNICSQIDEILVNVTFPQPYVQAGEGGVDDGMGEAISPDVSPIQMGVTRMFLLADTANIPPGYLTPPDGPIQRQMEERERLIAAIYSLAGLERKDPDDIKAQSGVAKSYDFRETNARLGSIAQAAERLEFEIFGLLNAYGLGGEFNVAYRKDYNVRDFRLVLEDAQIVMDLPFPPEVKKRSLLEAASQIAEDASPEEKQEIQQAVENMDESALAARPANPLESALASELNL